MRGGYCGQLIEVDLTKGRVTKIALPPAEELRQWIGGSGLGLHLLAQRLQPGMKATSPETPVMVMTGPLTGTKAPSSSDWAIVTLHSHIEYAVCMSHAHGHFGARLKHAGYDGLIIHGAAPHPVYLWIDDQVIELREASDYWGMDTFETQQAIKSAHADQEQISVACIGPAGENLLMGASVRADRAYGCNRGGAGVVWGSKNLKAVAVRGTGTVPISDNDGFIMHCQEWKQRVLDRGAVGAEGAGGMRIMPTAASEGWVPAMNFLDPVWPLAWGERYAADMEQWKITPVGGWECDIQCHHETFITTGPFAGTYACGYGAEAIEDGGTLLGIEDPGTCLAMANFYDAMGCDPSESGRMIAMAFELYEKGLITEKETGGLKLTWGNDEAARELFMKMLYREGPLGSILARGYKATLKELGVGTEDMFVHIKGVGFNSHDLRGLGIGRLFGSMVSGAGPTWQGNGVELDKEPDLGYEQTQDKADPTGKAEACARTQAKKLWEDCTGVCYFVTKNFRDITRIVPRAISLATGWELDWQEARAVGERLILLQRLIALSRGFKKENDLDASSRILADPGAGPARGRALGPHLHDMLDDYYRFLGWNVATGEPTRETLCRLGMDTYTIGAQTDS